MKRVAVAALGTACVAMGACSTTARHAELGAVPAGSHYVALGSSFASGPGLPAALGPLEQAARCMRSKENYAQQLARRLKLELTDVTCTAAKTSHVLGPWDGLPPQVDALRPSTRLVTVTIGGNDVGYIGGLLSASCHALGLESGSAWRCGPIELPAESAYQQTAAAMRALIVEIQRRAPRARILLVDYIAVLPTHGSCALTPLSAADMTNGRAIAARLEQITAEVARDTGAELFSAAALSRGHDVCSPGAWVNGFARPPAGFGRGSYHPNLAGMTAIAAALEQRLIAR